MPNPDGLLTVQRFSFSVRLNSIFFPLSVEELAVGLETLGYTISEHVRATMTPGLRPMGVRVSIGGIIAEKAEPPLRVRIEMDKGILGVDGRDIDQVIEDFRQIENWIAKEHEVDLGSEAKFYESIFEGTLAVGRTRSPIDTLKQLFSDSAYPSKFSEAVGREVTNFGIRLVEKGQAPTGDTWFDLRIEPSVQRSASDYMVNAVIRGPSLLVQVEEVQHLQGKIHRLVSVMEGS